jgi:DNA-binding transcriptional LysR family regulator
MLLGRHPIDVEGPLTPSKIAHLPLAMPNQRSGIRRKLDAAFRRAKLSPMILDVDSYQVIMELVDRGEAYSVTPACSAAISAPARESEFWRRPFERLSITWALAVQTKRQSSIVVAQIADLIKAAARDWIDASALSVRASERATSSKASSLAAYRKDKPRIVG